MGKTEIQGKSAVVILDRKNNKGLLNAIFYETDPSGHFFSSNIYFKEINRRWFTLASSFKFQRYSHGRFNRLLLFDKSIETEIKELSNRYERVYVIATNAIVYGPIWCGTEFRRIKKLCQNVFFAFYYIDIVSSNHSRRANLLLKSYPDLFDLIYTSDQNDARSYNLIYYTLPYAYSRYANIVNSNIQDKKDLVFCANIKKRSEQIVAILEGCKEYNVTVSMDLLPNNEFEKQLFSKYNDDVTMLNGFKRYEEIIKKTLTAGCILDLVQDGQTALSMRPYEAVVYKRKLLTNNPSILDFKYYNPKYIQFFTDVRDINWDWVKETTAVDYGYMGDFSPLNLWTDMEERLM